MAFSTLDVGRPYKGWVLFPVDLTTMTNSYDSYDEFTVFDGVQNSVVPLPNTALVITREFLVPGRTRIVGKALYSLDDLEPVSFRKGLDFLDR